MMVYHQFYPTMKKCVLKMNSLILLISEQKIKKDFLSHYSSVTIVLQIELQIIMFWYIIP